MNREESIFGRLTTGFRPAVSVPRFIVPSVLAFLGAAVTAAPLLHFTGKTLRRDLMSEQRAHLRGLARGARNILRDGPPRAVAALREYERAVNPGGHILVLNAHRPGWLLPGTHYPADYTPAAVRARFARNFAGVSVRSDLREYLKSYGDTPAKQVARIRAYMNSTEVRVTYPLAGFSSSRMVNPPREQAILDMAVRGDGFLNNISAQGAPVRFAAFRALGRGDAARVVVVLAPVSKTLRFLNRLRPYEIPAALLAGLVSALLVFAYLFRMSNRLELSLRGARQEYDRERRAYERFAPLDFSALWGREHAWQAQPGDHVRLEATMLAIEIQSFTDFTLDLTDREIFRIINDYARWAGPLIEEQGGIMVGFTGEAWLALFAREPEDASVAASSLKAASALRTAVALRRGLDEFNRRHMAEFESPPTLNMGLHTGPVNAGLVGAERGLRALVISQAVRTVHRVRGLAGVMGVGIACGEETLYAVEDPDEFGHRFLGTVPVRGRERISVFEIYRGEGENITRLKSETRNEFENGIERFYAREFAAAAELFAAVLERNPADGAAELYLKRSREQ